MKQRLTLDRGRFPSRHCVASLDEALQRMTACEYGGIDLYTSRAGQDDYGLVAYLAATWPAWLRQITVRTIHNGTCSATWDHDAQRFVLERPQPRPRRDLPASDTRPRLTP